MSLCVQVLCDWTKTDLDSSEGSKGLLTRSQSDDVSFDQQTDRQINQMGVTVRPVKGPWRGSGCVQIRVERWRPPGFTHAPWQIVWGRRRRRGEYEKAVTIWVVYHFKYDDKWDALTLSFKIAPVLKIQHARLFFSPSSQSVSHTEN